MIGLGYPAIVSNGNSGTYVGDGTNNRTISHGLNRIPAFIFIMSADFQNIWFAVYPGTLTNFAWLSGAPLSSVLKAMPAAATASVFYVGAAVNPLQYANNNATTYYWAAV